MIKIKSLEGISYDKLFEAFSEAFIDYEIQINKKELIKMLHRRGFVPELSFGTFDKDKLVSFTFNGIGLFNGIKTAYDVGTGTIKEFRGQGLASEIFRHSVPFLKNNGATQYLLEVLQHNTTAVSVYRKSGFEVSREFNYFFQTNENINSVLKSENPGYQIKQIDFTHTGLLNEFWDFMPSWQNSFEALLRKPEDFMIFGAWHNQKLAGYCILEPERGDIPQIAVDRKYRRNGIGTMLIHEILKYNHHDSIKIINVETGCESITGFMESISVPLSGKQFEMIKQL